MKRYTEKEKEFIKENYVKLGKSHCAQVLNRSKESVKSTALRMGVKHSKDEVIAIQSKRKNTYVVNDKMFISEISAETSYLLGFLWADGYLQITNLNSKNFHYRIKLQILKTDADQIASLFEKTGRWNKQLVIDKSNNKESISFICSNPVLGAFLEEHDFKSKSFVSPFKILNRIPPQFHKNFLHGYLDGDGCIFAPQFYHGYAIKFTSTYNQDWDFLIKVCNSIGCSHSIYRRHRTNSKYSSFEIHGSKNCILFCDFIYGDKFQFGLSRKFEKYILIRKKVKKMIEEKNIRWRKPEEKYLIILNKKLVQSE